MKKLFCPFLLASFLLIACNGTHNANDGLNNSGGGLPLIDSSKSIGVGVNGQGSNTEGYSDTSTTKNPLIDTAKKKRP